jgi:dihydrofolate reductase
MRMSVVFDISMSVDGYLTAADRRHDPPLGGGGETLHTWAMGDDPANEEYLAEMVDGTGAVITGRRNYDDSLPWWDLDGPTGARRRPVFVVTHRSDQPRDGSVYTFVPGIDEALVAATAAADGKNVVVMGGAAIAQQFIAAGLVDEITIHLVPVLFGDGTRTFGELAAHLPLELTRSLATPTATHLHYRVLR